jgi:6-phosphogluconolactonase
MADRALLSRAEGATIHRMRGELGPEDGAAAYENELGEFGPDALDLILVGIGPDAHICSLFPGDDALGERERRAVGVETPGMAPLVARITLTLPVVSGSGRIFFLVTGEDKAEAVQRVFSGPPDPRAPGSLVEGKGIVVALLDPAAAARL